MRIRLDEEADKELSGATAQIEAQRTGFGDQFVAAVAAVGDQLLAFPQSGQKIRGGFRRILLNQFPYQLIYRVEGDEIMIYAVAHQSRRPGYWRKRLPAKS